ncbi:MAG: formate dehydrogenase accessory sulfurtransferase FdhD [Myxococcota bacterium]
MATDILNASYDAPEREGRECVGVARYDERSWASREDCVAVEEPLEIRLGYQLAGRPAQKSLSVTMRTPGADKELAAGFLYGEGIVSSRADIEQVEVVAAEADAQRSNILRVHVGPGVQIDTQSLQRHFYTTSSCGVCGKASLEALRMDDCEPIDVGEAGVSAEMLCALPDRLRVAQDVFDETGGLHAAGLFDMDGALLDAHEDVGRHNAMDKLVGARLLAGELPLDGAIVVLSGRASFELLQKALRARVAVVVSVGAPSSLAVRLAESFGITLVGFARRDRLNVYSHADRLSG